MADSIRMALKEQELKQSDLIRIIKGAFGKGGTDRSPSTYESNEQSERVRKQNEKLEKKRRRQQKIREIKERIKGGG